MLESSGWLALVPVASTANNPAAWSNSGLPERDAARAIEAVP